MAASAIVMTASAMAGGAAVSAATVFAAIGQVGMIMTVAGAVTGDKELSKWGGTLGVIGGVGGGIAGLSEGLANDALSTASMGENGALSTNSWAGAEDYATNNGSAWDVANDNAMKAVVSDPETKAFSQSLADSTNPTANPNGLVQPDQAASALPAATPGVSAPPPGVAAAPPAPVAQPGAPVVATTATPSGTPSTPDVSGVNKTNIAGVSNPGAGTTNTDGYWKSFSNLVQKNDKLVGMGLQAVGGGLRGMQQQAQFDRTQGLKEQQQRNISAIPSLGPRGLIQSARAVA